MAELSLIIDDAWVKAYWTSCHTFTFVKVIIIFTIALISICVRRSSSCFSGRISS